MNEVLLFNKFLLFFLITLLYELTLALLLTFLPRLGSIGQSLSEHLRKAPFLDLVLSLLIWIPWVGSAWFMGWIGVCLVVVGQILALQLWIIIHELIHRNAVKGSRIVKVLNREIGWWRNHLALWTTIFAIPVFLSLRVAEFLLYPPLIWLLGFPPYKHSEWVTVSRFKFEGLVGHDLVWCLYCDWMTGVYSLGAEMLRNLESFWCPIRFYDGKKCENCQLDFPDLATDWIDIDGTMDDVSKLISQKYSGSHHSWYQHPERQTSDDQKS